MHLLTIDGPDAADFLQRQTMNDVRELARVGHWHWNGLLSPKGRVLALFALLRRAEHGFLLALPAGDADAVAASLQRMRFRSRVDIAVLPGPRVSGEFSADGDVDDPASAQPVDGGWLLDAGSAGRPRRLRLHVDADTDAPADAEAAARWHAEDLRHGLPHVDAALADGHTPQMLGLERLAAFSVKKGCYPGQEIVARTHFLGQAKRRLALFVGDVRFRRDELLRNDVSETRVLDAAHDAGEAVAVAVVTDAADMQQAWQREHGNARHAPFIDGLDRRPR